MAKATTIQELNDQILVRVYSMFSGMDEEYKKLVSDYHEIAAKNTIYTQDYIREYRSKIMADIAALKEKYGQQVLKQLEAIENEHTPTKNPKAAPLDTQGRLLYEIERMNNMKLYEARLQIADINGLKEMYDEHKDDADFLTLLDVRATSLSESNKALLEGHISSSKQNKFLDAINREKHTFNLLINGDLYPAFAERGAGRVKFRTVNSDLSNVNLFRAGWE